MELVEIFPRMLYMYGNQLLHTQALRLDALASVDEDDPDDVSFEFSWGCENGSGGSCFSRGGEPLLGLASSVGEAVLAIPAGSLPIGKLPKKPCEYVWSTRSAAAVLQAFARYTP